MLLEYIRRAWDAYRASFRTIVAAQIIYLGIVFVLFFSSVLPLFAGGLDMAINGGAFAPEVAEALIAPLMFFLFGSALTLVFAMALDAGRVGIYALALGKKKPDARVMFSVAGEKFWTIMGSAAIVAAIIVSIAALIVVPTMAAFAKNPVSQAVIFLFDVIAVILFALLFSLTKQAIVVGKLGAPAAVAKSFSMVKGSYIEFASLAAVFVLASLILMAAPLGFLITFFVVQPVAELSYTAFYMKKAGKAIEAKKHKKIARRKRR